MVSNTILDNIVEKKRLRLEQAKLQKSLSELQQAVEQNPRTQLDFASALKSYPSMSIIAEVKKASPSKGLIRADFNPVTIAEEYLKGDVQAMSILTEQDFFQGDELFLRQIRQFATIPLLRKDFLFDEYQLNEAYLMGADAVLLIAAILDDTELQTLQEKAHILGLQTLIEVHNQAELSRVLGLSTSPNMLGINNRDLKTFVEDLTTTERLISHLPAKKDWCLVSESAIRQPEDLFYVNNLGVDAVLVGEAFMRSSNIVEEINHMRSKL